MKTYQYGDNMNNNETDNGLTLVGGLLALAVITAPIWVPSLLGSTPKSCECGTRVEPSGIIPSCKCYY